MARISERAAEPVSLADTTTNVLTFRNIHTPGGYAVMLQTRRSRPHSQHQQHRQKQREALHCSKPPGAALLSVLVLFAALASSAGSSGRPAVSHRPCFLGLSFGEKEAPAIPEPPSLGDRVRDFGQRVRRGGIAGVLPGKGSDTAGGGAKAMAAAQVRGESQQPAKDRSNGRNSFVAGGLAGSVSTTITCPIEVISRCCSVVCGLRTAFG